MNLRKLGNSNEGVVGIVVAVLLIGLLVSVISLLQLYYVPAWMEEKEAEHMDEVLTQFSELKFAIDTQSSTKQKYTPIATSITLGSKELPFLMSMRAFGTLEILADSFTVNISNSSNSNNETYNLGIIKYTSANAYYIPEERQSFVYEAGAILTSQTTGNSISIKPSFKPVEDPAKIFFSIVNISGVADKVSWGGYDTIAIQTEFNRSINRTIEDVRYINITTSYSNAWYIFLNSAFINQGLNYGANYNMQVINDEIVISLQPNWRPDVELTYIEILAQIGPGWIE